MFTDRKEGETETQYLWRLGSAKDNGEVDLSWDEIARLMNREFRDEYTSLGESAYRKRYQSAKSFYDEGVFRNDSSENAIEELKAAKRELEKEKIKLRTEKNEYNKQTRSEALDELIMERIVDAINDLPPLKDVQPRKLTDDGYSTGVLVFADPHYGAQFTIKGIKGNIVNEYNPDIFERRMEEMLTQTIAKIDSEGFTHIDVISLGDEIAGILRVSQLSKLKYGIVESTIRYAEYICEWLNRLTKEVSVDFYMTEGNHSELRMLGEPKGTFADENMSRIIKAFIKIRMENNPNFRLVENDSGLIYDNIVGVNVLGIHGEVRNMERALKDFNVMYGVDVDLLLGGHIHHYNAGTVGEDKDYISVPSIMGPDDYAISLGKSANAGALFLVLEKGYGVTEQTYIKFSM